MGSSITVVRAVNYENPGSNLGQFVSLYIAPVHSAV